MGKVKLKKSLIFVLLVVFLFSCNNKNKTVYKYLDNNKSICKKAYWETVTCLIDEGTNTRITNSKIWYKNDDYRIEVYNVDMSDKQIIIIRDGKLYLFTKDKKIYEYNINDEKVEIFLRKIFVNIGFKKKKKKLIMKDVVYNQKKCDIYEYKMYRNINGLLCEAVIREWNDKKNMLVRVEADVFKTEFEFNRKKIYVGPLRETYEIKNHKCYFTLPSKLFELPSDYKIINFNNYYKQQQIKAGKTPVATDAGIATFVVKKKQ